eukprot:CAMPEP_0175450754 /NCGR_PEP_ID=MMETSP0095-20121207/62535_1 /TAXON_ID=311494 /ORGANISM="Alexandrium monilatum, Strain CCMP3105" /LENGTH=123 /DNA_ID=CAMNT_0016751241 /DNA_START=140 /DNA_END=508 /DNA_ORIENTATION=+
MPLSGPSSRRGRLRQMPSQLPHRILGSPWCSPPLQGLCGRWAPPCRGPWPLQLARPWSVRARAGPARARRALRRPRQHCAPVTSAGLVAAATAPEVALDPPAAAPGGSTAPAAAPAAAAAAAA